MDASAGQSHSWRVLDIPDELRRQPVTRADAARAGLSAKVLRGSRFRPVTRGVYITRDSDASYELQVRAALLKLPAPALATSVTGLWLYGVEVGDPLPLRFVTTHPHPVRRRGLRVTRSTTVPAHSGQVAFAEHCWLAAAGELNQLDLVTAGDWLLGSTR
jgi:hypothetical protein